MGSGVLAVAIASSILLPPLNLLLLAALGGVLLWTGRRRAGAIVVGLSWLLLLLFSTPLSADWVWQQLEIRSPPLLHPRDANAQAIVILGGGRVRSATEYGGQDQPSAITLARLRYGAWLHEQTGLPLLVTGGSPDGREEGEAVLMERALRGSFKVPVRWVEAQSDNTAENAMYSTRVLAAAGVKRVLLVTDAIHMERARHIFARYGLEVVPAPTHILGNEAGFSVLSLVPQVETLQRVRYAMHEWIGLLWYDIRYAK